MQIKNKMLLIGLLLLCMHARGQESISLSESLEKALLHHPQGMQSSSQEQIDQINKQLIRISWLPQLSINGQASYQSEVMELKLPFPGLEIPVPDKDQYRISLDIQQTIYDGGLSKTRQHLRDIGHQAALQETEASMQGLKEQVCRYYFQKILLDKSKEILELKLLELRKNQEVMNSAVRNGLRLATDALILDAEALRLQQQSSELETSIAASIEILYLLTGEDFSKRQLILPSYSMNLPQKIQRPEIKLFDLQSEQINASSQIHKSALMPRISGFAQTGYGRPGLNPISNSFDFYYMMGLRLNWNIWDWNKYSKEQQSAGIQSQIHQMRKEAFLQNIQIARSSILSRIQQLEKAAATDLQLIELQQRILETSESQLHNGTITSSEYLHRLNALANARLQAETHLIQKAQAITEYILLTGNF